MQITKDSTVTLIYTLHFDSFEGEVFEVATEEDPVEFKMSTGDMLDSFEAKLLGLKAGDEFKFMIPVDEAYGEEDEEAIVEFPMDMLEDVPTDELEPGNVIPLEDEDGNEFEALIIEVEEDKIVLDFNHPLAGEDLFVVGKVIEVK
ncbi:MAG: peptidylprolyl isomerase [Bacteroidales bacterium]|nr:peptidylprolyl isomerase [Bacteroidales bacterium]